MEFKRVDEALMLFLSLDTSISFKEAWIKQLKNLPYEKYGEYIRTEIYPSFSKQDQSAWNKNTISNKNLQTAIIAFLAG